MALSLQALGYEVVIMTSHHDITHCFEETNINGITLLLFHRIFLIFISLGKLHGCLHVYGDWLPRKVFGKFTALCGIIRMIWLSVIVILKTIFKVDKSVPDLYILDGISACIPILRWSNKPILFYCHFPDKLLCTDRKLEINIGISRSIIASIIVVTFKRLYRFIIDSIEELSTGCADLILVNSEFTSNIFKQSFKFIGFKPAVLYPSIQSLGQSTNNVEVPQSLLYCKDFDNIFVSINRYERKKNINLAIDALNHFKSIANETLPKPLLESNDNDDFVFVDVVGKDKSLESTISKAITSYKKVLLVICGGYDLNVNENKEVLTELQHHASELGISFTLNSSSSISDHALSNSNIAIHVEFRTSISDSEKLFLMTHATGLLYTPENEHFGIVPIESMYAECPVIAVNSGGPLETIKDDVTGFLCPQVSI